MSDLQESVIIIKIKFNFTEVIFNARLNPLKFLKFNKKIPTTKGSIKLANILRAMACN